MRTVQAWLRSEMCTPASSSLDPASTSTALLSSGKSTAPSNTSDEETWSLKATRAPQRCWSWGPSAGVSSVAGCTPETMPTCPSSETGPMPTEPIKPPSTVVPADPRFCEASPVGAPRPAVRASPVLPERGRSSRSVPCRRTSPTASRLSSAPASGATWATCTGNHAPACQRPPPHHPPSQDVAMVPTSGLLSPVSASVRTRLAPEVAVMRSRPPPLSRGKAGMTSASVAPVAGWWRCALTPLSSCADALVVPNKPMTTVVVYRRT